MRKMRRWGLAALAMIGSAALGWSLGWRWRDHHRGVKAWHMGDVPTWVGAIATMLALVAAAIAARGAYKQLDELRKQVKTQDDTLEFQKQQATDDRDEAKRIREADRDEAARIRNEDLKERECTRELDRQADRDARARVAAIALLGQLADLDSVLPTLPWRERPSLMQRTSGDRGMGTLNGFEVMAGLKRSTTTDLPFVVNALITKHYLALYGVVQYFHSANLNGIEVNKAQTDISRYIKWVRILITAYVNDTPLPADVKPPVVALGHTATNSEDWEPDPEPEGWQ